MEQYYFLFALGAVWSAFAVAQDLKTREVSNWLNFSLVAFGLVYRAFYSVINNDLMFFVSGLIGVGVFFALAHLFYYGKIFAGGDAKLLMGFGVILPYSDFVEFFYIGAVFIFVLFFVGAIYGLIYSVFIVFGKKEKFAKEFGKRFKKSYKVLFVVLLLLIILMKIVFELAIWLSLSVFLFLTFMLYFYVKSLDVCMIVEKNAKKLQEGDWLQEDVEVGGRVIKTSVHGLSKEEIRILRKAGKNVLIKEGIPFTPAFFLALIVIWYLFLVLGGFGVLDFVGGFGF